MHIDFDSESSVNRVPNSGNITLYNIPSEDIAALATDYQKGAAVMNPSQIELQAGYDKAMGIILFGSIYEATSSFTPDNNSIRLSILNNTPTDQSSYFSISLAGKNTLRDVCAQLANASGLILDYDSRVPSRVVMDFSFAGSITKQIENLRSFYNDINIFIDKKKLVIKSKKFEKNQVKIYVLNKQSGLLGTPVPKPLGCIIRTYLMPFVFASDYVKLETENIPNLNGHYRVQTIRHTGGSRSDNWNSELECIRV